MTTPKPDYGTLVTAALRAYQENSARTQQAREGRLGPSDIGFCRQKATLVTKEVQPTDSQPKWAAFVGTAVHELVKAALKDMFPNWLVEEVTVTATLPRTGAQISGTPDIIDVGNNALLDIKTKDGFEETRRYGVSLNFRMQRHLYVMGAVDAGLLNPDRTIWVGNVYLDRSGKEPTPHVEVEEWDASFTDQVDQWVEDVIYAVQQGEDASRDIAAARCETFCEFYTACRGGLPMSDPEPITDPEIVHGIDMYVEGRDLINMGKKLQQQAKPVLEGVNGSDGRFQVRWTTIAATEVPGYVRAETQRLDVRKVKK